MTMNAPDIWHVKLENGEVKILTLDQLDAGYKDGWIRGRTPVLAAGALRWSPLRDVAGLDPSGPWEAMPESVAPQAIDIDFGNDLDSKEIPNELRPKRTGLKVFGVLVVLCAIGGIGFAATRATGLVTSAKTFITSHMPGKAAAPVAAAPAKVEAPKPPEPPPQATAPVPAPPQTAAGPMATMNVSTLPSATPAKKGKGKRR
jgi:hypothetical protein